MKSLVSGIAAKASGLGSPAGLLTGGAIQAAEFDSDLFYQIRPGNWYQTFPFFFEIKEQTSEGEYATKFRFFLPIPPQNMTVQDLSTSEAHATLGGVVEETSPGVFNLITLVGTTGLSSAQTNLSAESEVLNTQFRKYIDDLTGRVNPLAKLVGNTIDAVTEGAASLLGIGDTASLPYQTAGSAVQSSNINSAEEVTKKSVSSLAPKVTSSGTAGGFGSKFLAGARSILDQVAGPDSDPSKYQTPFANGYSWSHGLRQLFLIYQREKAKNPNLSLHFVDVKANTSYRCVVRSAQFTQNAKNPFIISYNLSLKCWKIGNVQSEKPFKAVDRFGEGGDLQAVNTANLTAALTNFSNTFRNFQRPGSVAGSLVKSSTSSFI